MAVVNLHHRTVRADRHVGGLLDGLAGADDRLWPHEHWPAMRFDRPLGVGAVGGHGPIRYRVEAYVPGTWIRFRFTAPRGFDGYHEFCVHESAAGTRLEHRLVMAVHGPARLTWPLASRPLHDALIEDCLDRAEHDPTPHRPRWGRYVRALRALAGGGRRGGNPRRR